MTKEEFISALILLGWTNLSHIHYENYLHYNNFSLAIAFKSNFKYIHLLGKTFDKTLYINPTLIPIIISYMKDD